MTPRRSLLLILLGLLLLAGCCPPGVSQTSYRLESGQLQVADLPLAD